MRLACPNCDAKYEVPDDAIPEGGRDVQCSACGHAWFQLRPEAEMAAEEEAALYGDDVPAAGADAVAGAVRAAVAETAPPPASPAAAAAAADEDDEDEAPARRPAPDAMAPALEDSVLAVLREEAEREAEVRRQEAQRAASRTAEAEGQMQTQPDLGMETAATAGAAMTATQRRLAMLKGEDPDAPPPAPMKPPARRDLLPDVEEINSTLQPGETAGGDDVDALPDLTKSGSGFRTGFFLALFLLAVAAVVYVAAPSIGAAVPALDGAMAGYVAAVDGLRAWLNDLLNSASDTLNPGG